MVEITRNPSRPVRIGTITIGANGAYSYTLNNADLDTEALTAAISGSEVFSYTVADPSGATSTSALTLTISGGFLPQKFGRRRKFAFMPPQGRFLHRSPVLHPAYIT